MGLLDTITNAVSGGSGAGNIMDSIGGLLKGNGLNGLIEKLNLGGLGDTVSSWIGSGENKAVSGADLGNALGADQINEIAAKTGLNANEVQDQLAQHLPGVINHLTPNGQVEDTDNDSLLEKAGGFLQGLFK